MPEDPDGPKRRGFFAGEDPDANPLVILASYAAVIVLIGAIAGACAGFLPYYLALNSSSSHERRRNTDLVLNNDTVRFVKWRFWTGAAIGSGGTIIAMIVMNRKKKP